MSYNPDRKLKKIIIIAVSAIVILAVGIGVIHYTSVPKVSEAPVGVDYMPEYEVDNGSPNFVLPSIEEIIEETDDGKIVYETVDGQQGVFDKEANLEIINKDGDPNEKTVEELNAEFDKFSEDFLKHIEDREDPIIDENEIPAPIEEQAPIFIDEVVEDQPQVIDEQPAQHTPSDIPAGIPPEFAALWHSSTDDLDVIDGSQAHFKEGEEDIFIDFN